MTRLRDRRDRRILREAARRPVSAGEAERIVTKGLFGSCDPAIHGLRTRAALTHLEPRLVAEGHCDVCSQPIKGPDLCATDVDMGPCHAACLEGSPVVDLETGEPLPEGAARTYRWDSLPAAGTGYRQDQPR